MNVETLKFQDFFTFKNFFKFIFFGYFSQIKIFLDNKKVRKLADDNIVNLNEENEEEKEQQSKKLLNKNEKSVEKLLKTKINVDFDDKDDEEVKKTSSKLKILPKHK